MIVYMDERWALKRRGWFELLVMLIVCGRKPACNCLVAWSVCSSRRQPASEGFVVNWSNNIS